MITKFGQQIELIITDLAGRVVVIPAGPGENTSLRVDFDILHMDGFSRGTIKIYNLRADVIGELVSTNHYVTLNVRLHDGPWFNLVNKWYISNSINELQLPNNITQLFCFDKLRLTLLEAQLFTRVKTPTLEKMINNAVATVGSGNTTEFKHFPEEVLRGKVDRSSTSWSGSVDDLLRKYKMSYRYNVYTIDDGLTLMYKPTIDNVHLTDIPSSSGDVFLDTSNMRSNPKLGAARITATSNLDPNLKPTTVVNISNLLTASLEASPTAKEIAGDFVKMAVGGYPKYQILTTQHRGSNYSDLWETAIHGVPPDNGRSMPTINWFR